VEEQIKAPSWVSEVGQVQKEIEEHFTFLEAAAVGELMGELQSSLSNMAVSHDRYTEMLHLTSNKADAAAEAASEHTDCGSSWEEARAAYSQVVGSIEGGLQQALVSLSATMNTERTRLHSLIVDRRLVRQATAFHASQVSLDPCRDGQGLVDVLPSLHERIIRQVDQGLWPVARQLAAARRLSELVEHRLKQMSLVTVEDEDDTKHLFHEVFAELAQWPVRLQDPSDLFTRATLSNLLERDGLGACPSEHRGIAMLGKGTDLGVRRPGTLPHIVSYDDEEPVISPSALIVGLVNLSRPALESGEPNPDSDSFDRQLYRERCEARVAIAAEQAKLREVKAAIASAKAELRMEYPQLVEEAELHDTVDNATESSSNVMVCNDAEDWDVCSVPMPRMEWKPSRMAALSLEIF